MVVVLWVCLLGLLLWWFGSVLQVESILWVVLIVLVWVVSLVMLCRFIVMIGWSDCLFVSLGFFGYFAWWFDVFNTVVILGW